MTTALTLVELIFLAIVGWTMAVTYPMGWISVGLYVIVAIFVILPEIEEA